MRILFIFVFFAVVLLNLLKAQEITITSSTNTIKHLEKSGFFVGVHGGVSILYGLLYNANGNNIAWSNQENLGFVVAGNTFEVKPNIGIKLGWTTFFTPLLGIRAYFNYDYSDFRQTLNTSKIAFEDTSINADLLLNFWNGKVFSIGMFLGFGLGYELPQWFNPQARIEFENNHNYNGFILPVNLGINFTLYAKHRIEFGVRIPSIATRYKSNNDGSGFGIRPCIISIGYIHIF